MGRKQKERQKKKNNQKLLLAATATATATATAAATATATATATAAATATATTSSGEAVGGGNNSATAGRSNSFIDVDGDVATAKKRTTTETTTMATCYHGSTAINVAKGSHFQKVIDEWYTMCVHVAGKIPTERNIMIAHFHVKHMELMKNPEFNQCVFTVGTDIFLKNSYGSEEYSSTKRMLQTVLNLGLKSKYWYSPVSPDREKSYKYNRDIMTDRGIINVLDRETNSFCNCMTPYKEEAKRMEKVGSCYGCSHEFPKQKLRRCSRCLAVQYCSIKCMKKSWPTHKQICTPHNTSEK